jgi:hypothetical protein
MAFGETDCLEVEPVKALSDCQLGFANQETNGEKMPMGFNQSINEKKNCFRNY